MMTQSQEGYRAAKLEEVKPKCCGSVWPKGAWHSKSCEASGSLEHEGLYYCKRHHPPTIAAKNAEREQEYQARNALFRKQSEERQESSRKAAEYDAIKAERDALRAVNAELLDALNGVLPYMEEAEKAGLVGDEGCHWPVESVRAALTKAKDLKGTE